MRSYTYVRMVLAVAAAAMLTLALAQDVHEAEYAVSGFEFVGPTTLPAGTVTLHLTNETDLDADTVALIALGGGRTLLDFFEAMGALMSGELLVTPEWIHFYGGVFLGPDDARTYTTFLAPGTYYLLSIGADDEGPYAARGMLLPIEVEAPQVDFDATVTLRDYEFAFDGDLVAGAQVLRVHNAANQPHEMIMFPLPPGVSLDDMLHAMMEGEEEEGPSPAMVQGIWAMDPGVTVYVNVDLVAGSYGILCFIPDADGPHFMQGMAVEVVVHDASGGTAAPTLAAEAHGH